MCFYFPSGVRGSPEPSFPIVVPAATGTRQLHGRSQQPEETGAAHTNRRFKGTGPTSVAYIETDWNFRLYFLKRLCSFR